MKLVNVDDRLNRTHGNFKQWLAANHESVALRYIRSALFNIKKLASDTPWCNCKASDMVLLVRYLYWFASLKLRLAVSSEALNPKR